MEGERVVVVYLDIRRIRAIRSLSEKKISERGFLSLIILERHSRTKPTELRQALCTINSMVWSIPTPIVKMIALDALWSIPTPLHMSTPRGEIHIHFITCKIRANPALLPGKICIG